MEEHIIEVDDTFGLEFAAVQWLNLVTNAEKLFNKLLHSIVLSGDEKEQIQRWLCLKQECEECVGSDEATSVGEHHRHSLERIEELTEGTEHTEESSDSNGKSSDSQYESDTESDFDSHHPDFEDKLDGYLEKFKDKTDILIRSKLTRDEVFDDADVNQSRSSAFLVSPMNSLHQRGRRKSLHPGSVQPLLVLTESEREKVIEDSIQNETLGSEQLALKNLALVTHHSSVTSEPYKEQHLLSAEMDTKRAQIKQMTIDIDTTRKRMDEIQHTIKLKQQFIKELVKHSKTRDSAKMKSQKKWGKLEEEYYKIRTQLAQKERAFHESRLEGAHEAFTIQQKDEIEKYRSLAKHYEKRLKDIDIIKQIAGDSAKKVLELQSSIAESKKQIEKIKKQLLKDEGRKLKLEKELKNCDGKEVEVAQKQLKKSSAAQIMAKHLENGDDKEGLRQEIRNLRKTRDFFLDQRSELDEKYQEEQTLSALEERARLECDEAIEAIDTAIEHKNELICGRISFESNGQREQMLMAHLRQLSPTEMRTHLYKYFQKVIDLKEGGKKMEQQLYEVEQDNENLTHALLVADRQIVALQREHQEKLHHMLRHFADESSSSGTETGRHLALAKESELSKIKRENKQLRRRLQELETLIKTAGNRAVKQIRSRSASPDPTPLKQLPPPPSSSSSSSTKLTLEKNKVIIRLNAPKKKSTNKEVLSVQQSQMMNLLKKS